MNHREDLPRRVRRMDDLRVEVSEGLELSARIWLPEGADDHPVPAILEYMPYRQRDLEAWEDSVTQPYLAAHGYASVRCDLRGSGDSDGVLRDEYLDSELSDGEALLRWIAAQPWCNGRCGLFGISWGGFNGLQIAARRPPELKAVITACSTDDRYADDIHYMGGCLLGDNLSWASNMLGFNSLPPDPDVVGERWREMWIRRLKESGLWVETWLRHPHRDAYWKHGSVCEDHAAIEVPVMAVSGWYDGYSNAVFRLLEGLDVPRKGLIGAWGHQYPHLAQGGMAIGFLQECLRWWDRWLKGIDNGVMDEPMLRVWMSDSHRPQTSYFTVPGRWVAETSWPPPEGTMQRRELRLDAGASMLTEHEVAADQTLELRSPLSVGKMAGKWLAYSLTPDLPGDQREDDGGSLVFDSAIVDEAFEILGAPIVELELASDRPAAQVAVRLCDLAPDGSSTRVSYGLLNLCHRDSHEHPEPLEPGRRYRVSIRLNDTAQRFAAGHRIRLAISSCYWPLAWPSPETATLTLHTKASKLVLPVRPIRESDAALRPFEEAEGAPPIAHQQLSESEYRCKLERDIGSDEHLFTRIQDGGRRRIGDIDLVVSGRAVERYSHRGDDPTSARGEVTWIRSMQRGDWRIRTETRTVQTCTRERFHLEAELTAYEGDEVVHQQSWTRDIPRKLS